jgi:hypothetical protein
MSSTLRRSLDCNSCRGSPCCTRTLRCH